MLFSPRTRRCALLWRPRPDQADQLKNEAGQDASQTTAPGLPARAAPGLATLAALPGTWLQPPACKAAGSCIRHSGMPVCCRRRALGQERECW